MKFHNRHHTTIPPSFSRAKLQSNLTNIRPTSFDDPVLIGRWRWRDEGWVQYEAWIVFQDSEPTPTAMHIHGEQDSNFIASLLSSNVDRIVKGHGTNARQIALKA